METPSEISRCSLQLTGLFARLQQGKINVENVNIEMIRITDELDKAASRCKTSFEAIVVENKQLRQRNVGIHKDLYNKEEQIVRLNAKVLKLESERNKALDEVEEMKKWTDGEDTALLDASGDLLETCVSKDFEPEKQETADKKNDDLMD